MDESSFAKLGANSTTLLSQLKTDFEPFREPCQKLIEGFRDSHPDALARTAKLWKSTDLKDLVDLDKGAWDAVKELIAILKSLPLKDLFSSLCDASGPFWNSVASRSIDFTKANSEGMLSFVVQHSMKILTPIVDAGLNAFTALIILPVILYSAFDGSVKFYRDIVNSGWLTGLWNLSGPGLCLPLWAMVFGFEAVASYLMLRTGLFIGWKCIRWGGQLFGWMRASLGGSGCSGERRMGRMTSRVLRDASNMRGLSSLGLHTD